MADYASIIGGSGSHLTFDDVPRNADAFYHVDRALPLLDLSDRNGDSFVDGSGNQNDLHIFLGKGDDTVHSGVGDDVITGGKGSEIIDAGDGNNLVLGGDGKDVISAGSGNDTLSGGKGDDRIDGGGGNDVLIGGGGSNVLDGGAGDDTLLGDKNSDDLYGGSGDDVLYGGGGSDLLIGGSGDDTLHGGDGHDIFYFGNEFGHDQIADFAKGDLIMMAHDLNGSGIMKASDLAPFVSGNHAMTKITVGSDTLVIHGMDKDVFLDNLSHWVKVL